MSVSINPPRTPVTAGSSGTATATLPNVCKMPGPPAPFVPTPLPNIGKSGSSPKGYSKKVTIEGNQIAIKGATFLSSGDVASKGTGGGLVSSNTEGPTSFVGPGSMNVKIEGKNVQFLGDPMLNNCGPSGSPPNAATMVGILQKDDLVTAVVADMCPVCEKQPHEDLKESRTSKADAGSLATNFAKEVASVTKKISTMLGVVSCKCGKNYADQSAMTTIELRDAAQHAGMKHPADVTVSYKGPKKLLDQRYIDTLAEVKARIGAHVGNSDKFTRAWEKAEKASRDSAENRSGPAAYPPGTCAAQKTLMLLMDDDAYPAAMTERWYSSAGAPTQAPIQYIDNRTGQAEMKIEHFAHGATVPPCKACELILPFLLCPGDKEPACAHKS